METPTQALHRLTSYEPKREWTEPVDDPRILQDLEVNDIERLTWFFKRYEGDLPETALPSELPTTEAPAIDVLAGTAQGPPAELDLGHLARVLFLSAGITRTVERPYGTWYFRAAGSAGGRFPMELYVAVPEGGALPAGIHWYHPLEHKLVEVGPAPRGEVPTAIVTGVPWRTGWRYRERGYRHVYWDSGTMLSQLLAAADSAGIPARLHTGFPDASVTQLIGADGIHEWPVAVVALGDGEPALQRTGDAVEGNIDAEPVEFPFVTTAQHAGNRNEIGDEWPRGEPVAVDSDRSAPLEDVILARGSQRLMDRNKTLPRNALETCMSVAMRGISVPHWVAVNGVDDVEPGLYKWPDLSTPVRAGGTRDELYRVSLDQGLPADAAFVAISAIDVGELDDHGYRDAQLGAGIVEGRLHLLAYALGAGASGMTFLDSEIPALLGEELGGLLWTCVGVPEYRSASSGAPGAPKRVRMVTPRLD